MRRTLSFALILAMAATANAQSWRVRTRYNTPGPNPFGWGSSMAFDAARQVCVEFGGTTGGTLTWTWDGRGWTQYNVTPAPAPRVAPGIVYDSSRSLIVLYGGDYGTVFADTWEWNGTDWTLRNIPGPGPRTRHGMAYDSDRHVTVLTGGGVSDTWEYDGVAWSQRTTNDPVHYGSMTYDTARHITLLVDDVSTWGWNGQQWSALAASPIGPIDSSLVFDTDRNVAILFAGADFQEGQTHEWNGTAWTHLLITSPIARPDNAFAYDSVRQRAVLFGGRCYCDSGGTRETWEYGRICYADCDGISAPAVLNVNDFICFINAFAAKSPYANCDNSSIAPVLNANDYICFSNSYAAGCP